MWSTRETGRRVWGTLVVLLIVPQGVRVPQKGLGRSNHIIRVDAQGSTDSRSMTCHIQDDLRVPGS